MRGRGLFVTGTGTAVGKTILSASLIAAMVKAGERVRAYKPILTGLDEPPGIWPPDHELLGSVADMAGNLIAPVRLQPAVSPHLALQLAGRSIERSVLLETARAVADGAERAGEILIVEGVGGLLVPLLEDLTVRELAAELGLAVLIAASPGLGTINHTLLTIEAARAAGLEVRAVVFGPDACTDELSETMLTSNRATIEALGEVEVTQIPHVEGPDPAQLARAGEALAWRSWL